MKENTKEYIFLLVGVFIVCFTIILGISIQEISKTLNQPVEGELECNSGNIGLNFNTAWHTRQLYTTPTKVNNGTWINSTTLGIDKISLNGINNINCKIYLKQPMYGWYIMGKIIENII
jgi:hypothetical protein